MPVFKTVYSDVLAESDHLVNPTHSDAHNWWFVVGHTVNGGRFYSEPFTNYHMAEHYYDELKSLVTYFGGGYVELLSISEYDYDVVAISRI